MLSRNITSLVKTSSLRQKKEVSCEILLDDENQSRTCQTKSDQTLKRSIVTEIISRWLVVSNF